jgi:hypothetical protein
MNRVPIVPLDDPQVAPGGRSDPSARGGVGVVSYGPLTISRRAPAQNRLTAVRHRMGFRIKNGISYKDQAPRYMAPTRRAAGRYSTMLRISFVGASLCTRAEAFADGQVVVADMVKEKLANMEIT